MNARERMLLRRMARTSDWHWGYWSSGYGLTPGPTKRERRRLVRDGYIEIVGRVKMSPTRGSNVVRLTEKGRRAAFLLNRRSRRMPDIREPRCLADHERNRVEVERV